MNELTRRIKAKGYTLLDGLKALGISLATYRRYAKVDHKKHDSLKGWISELEDKNV